MKTKMQKNTDRRVGIRFDSTAFIIFFLLFVTEVCIAQFLSDKIIRPYGGDFLVVIMIFYFIKAFIKVKLEYTLMFVLLFAYAVELGQYFNLVNLLGLEKNTVSRTVIGTSFSWGDMIAYTLGIITCWGIEKRFLQGKQEEISE